MPVTITIDDDAAQALQTLRLQAAVRGLPFDRYLNALAESSDKVHGLSMSPHELSQAQFSDWLRAITASLPCVPPLPTDFSRANIYEDHAAV